MRITNVEAVHLCEICGSKVKALEAGVGILVCCGEPGRLVRFIGRIRRTVSTRH
ncbi:MAG: desulfoferrodoxin FeS4 iron-binding domain-containing protein [Candidatus Bathyarchaeia archaeon]